MHLPEEYVLRGGTVVDGTGREGFPADVVVTNGRIRLTGPGEAVGLETVDVTGMVVGPGFIDTHAHADRLRRRLRTVSPVFATTGPGSNTSHQVMAHLPPPMPNYPPAPSCVGHRPISPH